MPRRHDGAVVLVVKSGTAKVHDSYCGAFDSSLFSFLRNMTINK